MPTVTLGGQPATVVQTAGSQVTIQIPAALTSGPSVLVLTAGQATSYPVVLNVDTQPAQITQVLNASGGTVDASHPARTTDVLNINVSGFLPAAVSLSLNRVQIAIGGVLHDLVAAAPLTGSGWQLTVVLNGSELTGQAQQLIVYLDGRSSYPATIPLSRADVLSIRSKSPQPQINATQ